MDKSKQRILILVASIAIVFLIFFYVLKTTFVFKFIIISALFGPGMGISFGLENPSFKPAVHLVTLLIVNILSVVLIYAVLRKLPLEKRFKNKILDKVMQQVQGSQKGMEVTLDKVSSRLENYFGNNGFYLALGLITFAYGAYVTGAIAFFIKVKLRPAMASIALGSVISIIFWWYLAIGTIPFITPTMVFVSITGISILLIGYGFIKENKIFEKVKTEVLKQEVTFKREKENQMMKDK
jgi:uncharacterized membrane protein